MVERVFGTRPRAVAGWRIIGVSVALPVARATRNNPRGLATSDANEVPPVQSARRGSGFRAGTSCDLPAF